jgi:hypothetical protein
MGIWRKQRSGERRGFVMVRKQLTGMDLAPLRSATSEGTVVPACQQQFPGTSPAAPLPVVASPRAWFTSAPPCDIIVSNALPGATENASRGPAPLCRAVGPRAMCVPAKATEDAWHNRVSQSPGASPQFARCHTGKDAADDNARSKWGAVFTTEDGVQDRLRDSGEVVPCPSTTTGTNRTRDILRDSGAAIQAAPRVFLPTWDRDTKIPASIEWGNRIRGYCLFGGGFLDGPRVHPENPNPPRN